MTLRCGKGISIESQNLKVGLDAFYQVSKKGMLVTHFQVCHSLVTLQYVT